MSGGMVDSETCVAIETRETRPSLRRVFDVARINELANHPSIRPTCGGDGKSALDFTTFIADPKNYALAWNFGILLFQWSAPQTYEVHIMVLPEGRGEDAYRIAQQAIRYMVAEGTDRLWARISAASPGLRHYTAQAGFTKCGTDTLNIGFGPVTYDLYQWKKPCLQQS